MCLIKKRAEVKITSALYNYYQDIKFNIREALSVFFQILPFEKNSLPEVKRTERVYQDLRFSSQAHQDN